MTTYWIEMYRDIFTDKELIAWLDVSTYCNAACPQCHRTDPNGLGKSHWLPLIQWTIDEFKKAFPLKSICNFRRFEFCGTWGDPVMNKDLLDMVRYVRENNPDAYIQINTNGSIRDEDWWWDLGVVGGDKLQVWFDVDGIDQEMHSLYRQKTDLEKIKENIESYTSTGADSCAMVIVFQHNQDYLWEINEMLRDLGIKGKILFTESNRFYHGPTFQFVGEHGESLELKQSTLEGRHPLLSDEVPVRDHKWRKKLIASGKKTNDYW